MNTPKRMYCFYKRTFIWKSKNTLKTLTKRPGNNKQLEDDNKHETCSSGEGIQQVKYIHTSLKRILYESAEKQGCAVFLAHLTIHPGAGCIKNLSWSEV